MIETSLSDGILHIVLNRPERKNAFTDAMYTALADTLRAADADPDVLVVLLSGAGGAFSAGNDLEDFRQSPPTGPESPAFVFLRSLAGFGKPAIAAVEGIAVGIGATLLLHCDLVYAQAGTRFVFPFVSLGLVPEGASTLLLPRMVGHRRAAEILFFGEQLGAEQAQEIGLVNEVVTEGSALDRARARATRLTELPQGAIRATKMLLKTPASAAADAAAPGEVANRIDAEARVFAGRVRSASAAEAFAAFSKKRKPSFRELD